MTKLSWLIRLKMMLKNLSTDWSSERLAMRDLKKERMLFTHLDLHFYRSSLYFTLAWQSNLSSIFNVITDYLPFVNWTYRKPAKLTLKFQAFEVENIFRKLKFNSWNGPRSKLLKSKQIFSQKVNKCLQIDYDHRLTPFCQSDIQGPR